MVVFVQTPINGFAKIGIDMRAGYSNLKSFDAGTSISVGLPVEVNKSSKRSWAICQNKRKSV
ncbi:hypothetical protein PABG_11233 [Paracoccidioides brasiliensis Pb03]|nr:hypothetical protein PABG_11233 [Paracoccidioides brasiliensis Pb03]